MTSLLGSARRMITRGSDLGARTEALRTAGEAARGRLDDAVVDDVLAVADRAEARLGLSAEHTVVGLAGATGSGKSSTFNALAGHELSAVGVRRPTTSQASACVWGQADASALLDWLGVPPRHQSVRDSLLDVQPADSRLEGTVLLDLPDHDSTEVAHHLEVDRLVGLVDLLVWVLDPQKYADAAVHHRYLAPLASHADVMLVVLNQVDTVPADQREAMVADVRRLLAADGLPDVPVLAVSARHGTGVDALREEVARRARDKRASRARVEADLRAAADRLAAAVGEGRARTLSDARVEDLETALAEAGGVPVVVDAVERSTRVRAGRATGWPVTSWLARLRPDPLKRLHLDAGEGDLARTARSSLPATTPVQRARVDSAVRALADDASAGLTRPWAEAVRRASVARVDDLGDGLDVALGRTDLGVDGLPWWAGTLRVLQWVLLVTGLVGLAWLVGLAGMSFLGVPEPATPQVSGLPVPTVLLLGGALLGVALALAARVLVRATARRRGRAAGRRLRAAVREVAADLVVAPVRAELERHEVARTAAEAAARA